MKKITQFIVLSGLILLVSCSNHVAKIESSIIVEQINILEKDNYKFAVKLKTKEGDVFNASAYYYTNYRYQVGDTLDVNLTIDTRVVSELVGLKFKIDSLTRELNSTKYILEILTEKVIFDSKK